MRDSAPPPDDAEPKGGADGAPWPKGTKHVGARTLREMKAALKAREERLEFLSRDLEDRVDREPEDDHAQSRIDGWARQGVRNLAKETPPKHHVVLLAASDAKGKKVGVASSVQCEPYEAMRALGRLVAEVNRAFVRDNVEVKVLLRMEVRAELDYRGLPK